MPGKCFSIRQAMAIGNLVHNRFQLFKAAPLSNYRFGPIIRRTRAFLKPALG